MSELKKQLHDALVQGATNDLTGEALFLHAKQETGAKGKKIIHAAFFALSDPELKDRKVLDALYSLGLSHRLGEEDEPAHSGGASHPKAATLPLPERAKRKRRKNDN